MFKEIKIKGHTIQVNEDGTTVYRDGALANINTSADGYHYIYIKGSSISVHRLVALAFIENDDPAHRNEVNHKDFNRINNHYTNLEWMTHEENIKYSHEHGRYKKKYGKDNPNYGNTKLSEFYKEHPDIALEKQSRPATQNGRSTSIKVFKDGVFYKEFDYIGECAKYLHEKHGFSANAETVRCGIRRSIDKNRPYKGFTFEK